MNLSLHRQTPNLAAVDPRGLPVVSVSYYRREVAADSEARIGQQLYNGAGRAVAQWDARLWAHGGVEGEPNQATVYSLSGQVLSTQSVDSGWRITLFGDAGQTPDSWNGRGTHRQTEYDLQGRPMTVHEQLTGSARRCVERFIYGDATQTATNRCARVISHDDLSGRQAVPEYGLLGLPLTQTQQFLLDVEAQEGAQAPLEDEIYASHWQYDAQSAVLCQTDAVGNRQRTLYDVAGQLTQTSLIAPGMAEKVLLHGLAYNAAAQVIAETSGNGVVSTATYSAIDGRLLKLHARRPDRVLQDLSYTYDPVGNVQTIEDAAQPTDWFGGTRADPVSTYQYDTLYQLTVASGRESVQAGLGASRSGRVRPTANDASRLRPYTQSYTYDAGGNLLTLAHSGMPTRRMVVAERSNRSMPILDESTLPDISAGFDMCGNLLKLAGARALEWNTANQLQRVTQVVRGSGTNDHEVYVYAADGQRRRKVHVTQAKALNQVAEVRYLPGLEIRTDTAKGEVLYVTTVQGGRSGVKYLHWQPGTKARSTPQVRYSVNDHLRSSTLELDDKAQVLSQEGYYPYGGTAWWATSNSVEASFKTIRYSGKERDATGLYYYGLRYYAPWLSRWINPDPAGDIDGLNLFRMVQNNPVSLLDNDGRQPAPFAYVTESDIQALNQWGPESFTNPAQFNPNGDYQFLVHTVPISEFYKSAGEDSERYTSRSNFLRGFFRDPDPEILSRDFISTSLISNDRPAMYGSVGFILNVPPQNILWTSDRDIDFRNNLASRTHWQRDHTSALFASLPDDQKFTPGTLAQNATRIIKHHDVFLPPGFSAADLPATMKTPSELAQGGTHMNAGLRHNEIIVGTRPGVNIYPGMGATRDIEVVGLIAADPLLQPTATGQFSEEELPFYKQVLLSGLLDEHNEHRARSGRNAIALIKVAAKSWIDSRH